MEEKSEVVGLGIDARIGALTEFFFHEKLQALSIADLAAFRFTPAYLPFWDAHVVALVTQFPCSHGHVHVACLHRGEIHFRCVGNGFKAVDLFLVRSQTERRVDDELTAFEDGQL